jgi:hypothetical protein
MAAFKPGDVTIYTCILTSPRGTVDLTTMFGSCRIYESIFNPSIIMQLELLDVNDTIGQLNFVGDEMVNISFGAPGTTIANYNFAIHEPADVKETGALKSKTYTLNGVSQETMYSKTNYVQKSYNTDISSIIQDIHSNYLNSSKSLSVEITNGVQKIIIPNKSPFEAIDMIRRRAVSSQNQSSTFVYFENALGFNFKTIEGMFSQGAIKYFIHEDAVSSSIYNINYNNIIALEVPKVASALDRIAIGGLKQRISTYNVRTRKYTYNDIDTSSFGNFGSSGRYNSDNFKNMYGQNYGKYSVIPQDTSQRPATSIDTATPYQLAYLSNLKQNQVNIKVFGDCIVKAGDIVNLLLPQIINQTGGVGLDLQLSGNFVVTRICRNIGISQEHPRFTDTIELMSGSLNNGV